MIIIEKIKKKMTKNQLKPFIYSDSVRSAYEGRSICGGKLYKKNVLITGATGDIGISLARRFILEGSSVFLVGRDEDKLNILIRELKTSFTGCDVKCLVIDNTKVNLIDCTISKLINDGHRIDYLINNSGVFTEVDRARAFRGVTEEQFYKVWATNYIGTKELTKKIVEYMSAYGNVNVINISSICADYKSFSYTPYGISKKALLSLNDEISKINPRCKVRNIQPGSVATKMNNVGFGDNIAYNCNQLGRAALPEEIAAITAWCCSIMDILDSNKVVASGCENL